MTLGFCSIFTVLNLMSSDLFSQCCMEKVQPKADLQRLCHYGDCLGLLLMHARGGFLTLMAHVQTSVLFDDLDRAVSG